MKKIVILVVVFSALVFASVVAAEEAHPPICPPDCDDGEVLILPWRFPPGTVVEQYSDQSITLAARWGACTKGLVQMFKTAAVLDWTVAGSNRIVAWPESKAEWGIPWPDYSYPQVDVCVMNTDAIWWTYFEWPLGTLIPGDYPVYLHYSLTHPVIDGGDWDGDGKPDSYNGVVVTGDITLRILER